MPNKPWEIGKDSFGEEPGGYSKEVQFFKLSLRNQTEFLNAKKNKNFDQQMFNNDLESTNIIPDFNHSLINSGVNSAWSHQDFHVKFQRFSWNY